MAGARLQVRSELNSIDNLARSFGIKLNRFRSRKSLKGFQKSDETKLQIMIVSKVSMIYFCFPAFLVISLLIRKSTERPRTCLPFRIFRCLCLRLCLQTRCDTGVCRHPCLCPRNSAPRPKPHQIVKQLFQSIHSYNLKATKNEIVFF